MRPLLVIISPVILTLAIVSFLSYGCGSYLRSAENNDEYKTAKDLNQAVKICKQQLMKDGKPEYAALLSEQKVRQAIHSAVISYEKLLASKDGQALDAKYFHDMIKPICLKIANSGLWLRNCSFTKFYLLTDKSGFAYECFGLRLEISTPGAKGDGFGLPILDLYYGRFLNSTTS